ncbi:7-deoxyloganetin glucosyltransferase-like isoform X2 [Benincasa hispida]|uniref:7-deoxyloganetin glucosyltransferase-like isoform X2 n=1 Tax=Benincasa hispida TaxID=102211 RepID=UPI00190243DB|nr:7-deoxyloganetin glucosyltransferase-like isoform X2 [Benincasa hispida]
MGFTSKTNKPHAVCLPYPVQGHITPMVRMAKLLYHKGFHITFVNTEYNHQRLLKSRGPDSLDGLLDFTFRTIPDGLLISDANSTQDIPALCQSTSKNCLAPFCELISQLNSMAASPSSNVPPVSCIIGDGLMSFSMLAANEFNIPYALFWTSSACGYFGCLKYSVLVNQGLVRLKDESQITDGYLENTIEWTEGIKSIRLKDLPPFLRTTDPDDIMLNFVIQEMN